MIVTISGRAASGKSSVAKLLAKKLHFGHYSAGDMQRKIADEKGISITKLNLLEQGDDSIDRMIDAKTRELGEKRDDFVIDGWLAPCFIPRSFKVFLEASEDVRIARRLAHHRAEETLRSSGQARHDMRARESANAERWKRYYTYDYLDKKNYDLVIDTTRLAIEQVVQRILDAMPQ
jgi:cytidylate kinase